VLVILSEIEGSLPLARTSVAIGILRFALNDNGFAMMANG